MTRGTPPTHAPSRGATSPGTLDGRTIVVTGASDGIGRAAVRAYVERGASVVMLGRNEAKTAAAAQSIMTAAGRRAVTWEIADLSRQEAVRDVASRLLARHPRIDVLANNAGAIFLEHGVTSEGLERTFALNHLGYFTLTLLLLDRLASSATPGSPARIINVSSRAHTHARLEMDDLGMTRGYGGWRAYANSKLCNILFTRALAGRVNATRVVVHAMHPGVVTTRFATNNGWAGRLMRRAMDLVAVDVERGADTLVWLAESEEARTSSGDYWVKRTRWTPSRAARVNASASSTASLALSRHNASARAESRAARDGVQRVRFTQ